MSEAIVPAEIMGKRIYTVKGSNALEEVDILLVDVAIEFAKLLGVIV